MDRLVWKEEFQIENKEIDLEHQQIFEIYNELVGLTEKQVDAKIVANNLHFLFEFLRRHFRCEDAALMEHGCPRDILRRLHHEHQTLLDEIADSIGWDVPENIYRKSNQTLEILGEWLVRHIDATGAAFGAGKAKTPVEGP